MVPINLKYEPDFLNEEERDGYLVSSNMKKLWLVELDILNRFIQVCEKHGLIYWADAGTLLGAVRHNGFVPWDDDIDIIMPREDYDKFWKIVNDELEDPYHIECVWNSRGFFTKIKRYDTTRFFTNGNPVESPSKILTPFPACISIDIFPLDNCPDTQEERSRYFMKFMSSLNMCILARRLYRTYYYNGLKNKYNDLRKVIDNTFKRYNKISQLYNNNKTIHVYNSCIPDYQLRDGFVRYREDYEDSVYLPFEMLTLRCPAGYERCLDVMYTDRTGIPWQEPTQNLGLHKQDTPPFIDTDKPYTEYTIPFFIIPDEHNNTE